MAPSVARLFLPLLAARNERRSRPPLFSGPPYLPTTAGLGGSPTPRVDDPICAVLLVFFVAGAALNMTILQLNRRRQHKFLFSGMMFGFCMARTTALVMRIVWASRPRNVSIAIAGNVFTLAGVVLLFLMNLVFAQRMLRALHPRLGWRRPVTLVFRALFWSVLACIVMLITATVYNFYTTRASVHLIVRKIQLVGSTWFALLAFLPMPIVLLAWFLPLRAPRAPRAHPVDAFGHGRLQTKAVLLVFTSFLLTLGAGFRDGAAFDARPASRPAWYHSKPCYYLFNFVIEIVVVYTYTLVRFDRRFHVPNGASGPGHYAAAGTVVAQESDSGSASASHAPTPGPTDEETADRWDARARADLEREKRGTNV